MLNIFAKKGPKETSSAERVWNIVRVCSCIEDNLKRFDVSAEDNLGECRKTEPVERVVAFKFTAYDRVIVAIHSIEGAFEENISVGPEFSITSAPLRIGVLGIKSLSAHQKFL